MAAELLDQREFAEPGRRGVPAWALSVSVHLLAVLALGLLVRNVPRGVGDDGGRAVSIVLAEDAEGDSVEFVDGDAETDSSQQASQSGAAEPVEEAALPPGDATDATELFPDIALPGQSLVGGGDDEALNAPTLSVSPDTRILPGQGDSAILAAEARRQQLSGGPQGPPAEVSLFGSAPAIGHSFVFVVDRSKSMGRRGLNALVAVEKELQTALAVLDRNHKFDIVAYHSRPVYFSRKFFERKQLIPATEQNKERVADFFGGLAPLGHTEHDMALKTALYLRPDVIYFLTDGGDPLITDHQMRNLFKLAGGVTTIHCIQFGSGTKRGRSFMERLARETGGGFGYVDVLPGRAAAFR